MPKGKTKPIVIWGANRKIGKRGVASRIGQVRRGRRMSSSFSAEFTPKKEWTVHVDSRDLNAIVGTEIYRHLKSSIEADRDPQTGAPHPKTLRIKSADGRNLTRDRDVDTKEMAQHLRRTITASARRWGPGGKRISQQRTRMKFYFADRKWASVNKTDSRRKGKGRIYWLGIGGAAGSKIRRSLMLWMDRAIEGKKFAADTKSKAWPGI